MAERCLSTRAEEKKVVIIQQAPLYLDRDRGVYLSPDLVNLLADHQLAGVRFLYQQLLREYTGLFLNDEPGLGKCHQAVALLRAVVAADPSTRSMILCSGRERANYWTYHLELLVADESIRSRILVKTHRDLAHPTPDAPGWHYIAVDETDRFSTRLELAKLRSLKAERFVFMCSINLLDHLTELSDRLPFCCGQARTASLRKLIDKQQTKRDRFRTYLSLRPLLLRRYTSNYQRALPMVVKEDFVRRFHAWSTPADEQLKVKSDKSCPVAAVPKVPPEAAILKKEDTKDSPLFAFSSFEMTPKADAAEATKPEMDQQQEKIDRDPSKSIADPSATVGTVQATFSEPLFEPFEMDTEQMPALRVEPGSSTEGSMVSSQQTAIEVSSTVPETLDADSEEFLQLGQGAISCSNSSVTHQDHQPVTDVDEERYCFPMDKFQQPAGSSSSATSVVEQSALPNAQKPAATTDVVVITSSSSSSGARAKRLKSPSLFGDSDNDTASLESDSDGEISFTDMLRKSPGNLLPPITSKRPSEGRSRPLPLPRTLTHCSTPIAKLITAPLPIVVDPSQEINLSSADIFADSPAVGQRQKTRLAENVFEITKNAAFPNRIVVQENDDTGGLPGTPVLRIEGDLSDDDDDVVEIIEASQGVIDLVADETDACKTKTLEGQRTPRSSTSTSSIHRTGSGTGGLNRTPSSSGWLCKSKRTPSSSVSPSSSNSNTPTRGKRSAHPGPGSDGNRRRIGDRVSGREPSKRRRKLDEEFEKSERNRDLLKRSAR